MGILYAILGVLGAYILFLCLCALAVDPKREYTVHSRFYRSVLNGFTAVGLFVLNTRIHVTGLEKVPDTKRVLFVSNHLSKFDPIVTWHVLKKWDIAFISKPENFRIPIFGRLIRKCCFLAIDREDPRRAMTTIQTAAALLESGQVSVGVYPEGTRSADGSLLPFHNGVFKIARKADAPVAVLRLTGTNEIRKRAVFRRTHIYLEVLDVLPPGMNSRQLGAAARELLESR